MSRNIRQRVESIDRMIEALTALRRALPELERRNRYPAGGDGYPSASVAGGSSGGAIAKPTERAALSRRPGDPVRKWTREALSELDAASRAIEVADSRRRLVFANAPEPEPVRCVICDGEPSEKYPLVDERCRPCYQYRRRNGTDRPSTNAKRKLPV